MEYFTHERRLKNTTQTHINTTPIQTNYPEPTILNQEYRQLVQSKEFILPEKLTKQQFVNRANILMRWIKKGKDPQ